MRIQPYLFGFAAILSCASASAAHRGDCQKEGVAALKTSASDGYAIYQRLDDKSFFLNWVSCGDAELGLPTAVHESVHFVTAESDAFPLVDGSEIKRPHEVTRFFAPSRIAGVFKGDDFVATYLKPGRATSSSDFLYLLDEMNAYTHDLNAALDLQALKRGDVSVDSRDGLAALMAFVALYVEKAQASEPKTWEGLRKPEVATTVATLWDGAEKVMASSCGVPDLGVMDKPYIRMVCRPEPQAALESVIGHAPTCPTACLKADATVAEAETPVASRTLWSRRGHKRVVVESASDQQE